MFTRFFTCVNLGTYNNYFPNGGLCVDGGGATSIVPTGDNIYGGPIWLPRDFLLKQYGVIVDVVTTGGRNIAYGIYKDSRVLSEDCRYPGAKIDGGSNANITVTGFYSKTLGTPILLKGNRLYWAVFASDTTGSINLKVLTSVLNILGWQFGDSTYPAVAKKGFTMSWTFNSTLPDPFGSGGLDERFIPILYMREPNQNGT